MKFGVRKEHVKQLISRFKPSSTTSHFLVSSKTFGIEMPASGVGPSYQRVSRVFRLAREPATREE